jgi:hypothetical protein
MMAVGSLRLLKIVAKEAGNGHLLAGRAPR